MEPQAALGNLAVGIGSATMHCEGISGTKGWPKVIHRAMRVSFFSIPDETWGALCHLEKCLQMVADDDGKLNLGARKFFAARGVV